MKKMQGLMICAFIGVTFALSEAWAKNSGMGRSVPSRNLGDPQSLDDLFITEDRNGLIKFSLNLTAATITGLDQPQILNNKLQDDIVYQFETLNITGNYAQDGVLLVIIPTFGNGRFDITAKNVTITATGVAPNYDMFFYVNDVDATFEDYLGGGLMVLLAQLVEATLGDAVFKYFEPNIRDILNGVTM